MLRSELEIKCALERLENDNLVDEPDYHEFVYHDLGVDASNSESLAAGINVLRWVLRKEQKSRDFSRRVR